MHLSDILPSSGPLTETRRGLGSIGEMTTKVFWEPRHSDLVALLAKSKIGDIRGGIIQDKSGNIHSAIWPARNMGHWNFFNECFAREGIEPADYWSLRITRDLSTLTEERYWKKNTIYKGDGFYCAFTQGSYHSGNPPQILLDRILGPIQMINADMVTEGVDTGILTLWHGGKDVESDYLEIRSHGKGRWEYGPGLYLTDDRTLASSKYAKGGGRKLYQITIDLNGAHECQDVIIPLHDAVAFVERNVIGRLRSTLINELNKIYERRGQKLPADVMINLCLNYEAIQNSKTGILRQFLIDHGVDYSVSHGSARSIYVVINPRIIKRVERASNLREGLIAVPDKMFHQAMKNIVEHVLSWAITKATTKQQQDEVWRLAHQYNVELWRDYDIVSKPVRVDSLPIDLDGIPDHYPTLTDEAPLYTAVDWRPSRYAASWHKAKRVIIVYPLAKDTLKYWPHKLHSLGDYLGEIEASIRHELRHAVQTMLLPDAQNEQIYNNAIDDKVGYNTSPNEFDPIIGTLADNFVHFYNLMAEYGKKPDIGKMIRQTAGMIPPSFGEKPDDFFVVLRKNDPKRYKLAVKKFTAEIMRKLTY